jgi:hypothetical protein
MACASRPVDFEHLRQLDSLHILRLWSSLAPRSKRPQRTRGDAAQRGPSEPDAPHTPVAGRRGMARLPRKENRVPALRGPQHRRVRTHASPPAGVGRTAESRQRNPERSRIHLGRRAQGDVLGMWSARQGGTGPLAASPRRPRSLARAQAQAAGERRGRPNASASLAESAAATHRQHGLDA